MWHRLSDSHSGHHGRRGLLSAALLVCFVAVAAALAVPTAVRALPLASNLGAHVPEDPPRGSLRVGTAPDWLNEINRYREASGLSPVVEQPAWTLGIQHHLIYMEKTPAEYFTGQYASLHTENPASPYYTVDGAREAGYSNLGWGASDVEAIDVWLRAPFHAIGMLRARLAHVAFARSSSTSAAGLDVIQGLDYSRPPATGPVLFPGPGMVTDQAVFGGESPNPLETCGWQGLLVGLPLIAMLPQAPDPGLTASLTRPNGPPETTANGLPGIVDEHNYVSSDPVYGPTGLGILRGDKAILLIPRYPLANGAYSVCIQQPSQPDIAWSFSVDGPLPSTLVEGVPAGWVNHAVYLALSATGTRVGVAYTEYRVDAGTWTKGSTVSVTADGIHSIAYRSADNAGNLEAEKACEVKIDTVAPTTTVFGVDSSWHNAPVALDFSAADNPGGSGMTGGQAKTEYKLDSGDWTTGTSLIVPAPPGTRMTHNISYRSSDVAGNLETYESRTVRIDTTASPLPRPTLTTLSPTSGRRSATVTITGKGFGNKSRTSYVKFGAKKCTKYVSWSATKIKCKVPAKAKFGRLKVRVVIPGGTSNTKTFKVKR